MSPGWAPLKSHTMIQNAFWRDIVWVTTFTHNSKPQNTTTKPSQKIKKKIQSGYFRLFPGYFRLFPGYFRLFRGMFFSFFFQKTCFFCEFLNFTPFYAFVVAEINKLFPQPLFCKTTDSNPISQCYISLNNARNSDGITTYLDCSAYSKHGCSNASSAHPAETSFIVTRSWGSGTSWLTGTSRADFVKIPQINNSFTSSFVHGDYYAYCSWQTPTPTPADFQKTKTQQSTLKVNSPAAFFGASRHEHRKQAGIPCGMGKMERPTSFKNI